MVNAKQAQLKVAVTALQQKYGMRSITTADALPSGDIAIPTGFAALDKILSAGGIPVNAITVLSGRGTSGKRTLAYKILHSAQYSSPERLQSVALIDFTDSTDFDYVARCGVHLDHLFISKPKSMHNGIDSLLEMVNSHQLRAILVDHITLIERVRQDWNYFCAMLPQLNIVLKGSNCALLLLDEANTAATHESIGPQIALQLELQRTRWIDDSDELRGYQSRVRVLRTKRGHIGLSTLIDFDYSLIVRGHETW